MNFLLTVLVSIVILSRTAHCFECPSYGRFPDPSFEGCRHYVVCTKTSDGQDLTLKFTCPEEQVFDPGVGRCVDDYLYYCPGSFQEMESIDEFDQFTQMNMGSAELAELTTKSSGDIKEEFLNILKSEAFLKMLATTVAENPKTFASMMSSDPDAKSVTEEILLSLGGLSQTTTSFPQDETMSDGNPNNLVPGIGIPSEVNLEPSTLAMTTKSPTMQNSVGTNPIPSNPPITFLVGEATTDSGSTIPASETSTGLTDLISTQDTTQLTEPTSTLSITDGSLIAETSTIPNIVTEMPGISTDSLTTNTNTVTPATVNTDGLTLTTNEDLSSTEPTTIIGSTEPTTIIASTEPTTIITSTDIITEGNRLTYIPGTSIDSLIVDTSTLTEINADTSTYPPSENSTLSEGATDNSGITINNSTAFPGNIIDNPVAISINFIPEITEINRNNITTLTTENILPADQTTLVPNTNGTIINSTTTEIPGMLTNSLVVDTPAITETQTDVSTNPYISSPAPTEETTFITSTGDTTTEVPTTQNVNTTSTVRAPIFKFPYNITSNLSQLAASRFRKPTSNSTVTLPTIYEVDESQTVGTVTSLTPSDGNITTITEQITSDATVTETVPDILTTAITENATVPDSTTIPTTDISDPNSFTTDVISTVTVETVPTLPVNDTTPNLLSDTTTISDNLTTVTEQTSTDPSTVVHPFIPTTGLVEPLHPETEPSNSTNAFATDATTEIVQSTIATSTEPTNEPDEIMSTAATENISLFPLDYTTPNYITSTPSPFPTTIPSNAGENVNYEMLGDQIDLLSSINYVDNLLEPIDLAGTTQSSSVTHQTDDPATDITSSGLGNVNILTGPETTVATVTEIQSTPQIINFLPTDGISTAFDTTIYQSTVEPVYSNLAEDLAEEMFLQTLGYQLIDLTSTPPTTVYDSLNDGVLGTIVPNYSGVVSFNPNVGKRTEFPPETTPDLLSESISTLSTILPRDTTTSVGATDTTTGYSTPPTSDISTNALETTSQFTTYPSTTFEPTTQTGVANISSTTNEILTTSNSPDTTIDTTTSSVTENLTIEITLPVITSTVSPDPTLITTLLQELTSTDAETTTETDDAVVIEIEITTPQPDISVTSALVCTSSGRFPDMTTNDCKGYIFCVQLDNGDFLQFKFTCLEDSLFDPFTQKCSSDYTCPQITSQAPLITETTTALPIASVTSSVRPFVCSSMGRYPDPTDTTCNNYVLCINSPMGGFIQYSYRCLPPYIFNPFVGECSLSYTCRKTLDGSSAQQSFVPIYNSVPTQFSCSAAGRFPDESASDCKRYILCSPLPNGQFTQYYYDCSGNTYFNPYTKTCDVNYECQKVQSTTPSSDVLQLSQSAVQNSGGGTFVCTSTGRFSDPSVTDCSKYILCMYSASVGFTQYGFKCQPPSKFDPILRLCSTTYTCNQQREQFRMPMIRFVPVARTPPPTDPPTAKRTVSTHPPTTTRTTPTPEAVPRPETVVSYVATTKFICTTTGRFEDRTVSGCKGYVLCVQSEDGSLKPFFYSCFDDSLFDPTTMLCSNAYVCPYA